MLISGRVTSLKRADSDCMHGTRVLFAGQNLVDLAGSERAAKTGAEGPQLTEGTHIK